MQNRVFFPQLAMDTWTIDGTIDFRQNELILLAEGRRYKVVEAVRVVTEVTGANDAYKVVGKVKPKAALEELGAEIVESSMIIGDNAYDVVPGWMGTPTSTFPEHVASPERMKARGHKTDSNGAPRTEEELLLRFAEGSL